MTLEQVASEDEEQLVREARTELHRRTDQERLAEYEVEFDRQIATLVEKGFMTAGPSAEEDMRCQLERLREGLHHIPEVKPGRIPFVIAIPACQIPIKAQVKCAGLRSASDVRFARLDQKSAHDDCYLMLDIEMGLATRGNSGASARRLLSERTTAGRMGLGATELVALLLHVSRVSTRLNVLAVSSAFQNSGNYQGGGAEYCLGWDRTQKWLCEYGMVKKPENTGAASYLKTWVQGYGL